MIQRLNANLPRQSLPFRGEHCSNKSGKSHKTDTTMFMGRSIPRSEAGA